MTCQVRVTAVPEEIVAELAEKLEMIGVGPEGMLEFVYRGDKVRTSKSSAVAPLRRWRSLLFQRLSGVPEMYRADPLSARMRPYFFKALRMTWLVAE